jgi:hypothetical protein
MVMVFSSPRQIATTQEIKTRSLFPASLMMKKKKANNNTQQLSTEPGTKKKEVISQVSHVSGEEIIRCALPLFLSQFISSNRAR